MKTKTKKITYLTAGLTAALAASAVVGTALSSCTVTASSGTSNGVTLPDTWYNKDINWEDQNSLNNLLIDDQGIVYSSKYMTEIIAILPGYGGGTITIPASVKSISGYYNVTTNASGTGTTKTAKGAFEGLTSLTNVIFAGKNITQIGARAFYGCSSLQSINLPSSVSIIADNAFNGCASLNSINLNNVQYVGASAFSGAFTNIPFGSVSLDLNKTSFIGASAFSGATGLKTVDLSKNNSLASIGASAFQNCTYLAGVIDITSDKFLVSIGASAFSGCTSITNIYLPSDTSLRTIGASAFSGCTSLVSIGASGTTSGFIIPSTVTSIGASAFANTLISKIDLSQNTATNPLQASAFKDMTELSSIDLGTNITTLPADLFENTPKLNNFDLVLPASITSIAGGNGNNVGSGSFVATSYSSFYKSGFKSIDLSKIAGQLIYVPYCMFQDATNLEKVVLKSTTTQIQFRAFYGCSALKTVVFADSEGKIPDTTGFVALSNLSSIGSYAFYGAGLETIDLSAVTANIMGTTNSTTGTDANSYRFANNASLTSVKLPASTTLIPEYNFSGSPKLSSVNFNELTKLTSIQNNNFSGAAFEEIDLSKTALTSLSTTNDFANLTKQATVKLPASLTEVYSSNFTWLKPNTEGTGTTSTALSLSYPNGYGTSTTSYSSKILSASTSTSFSFLSRVSGELDFSNFANLNGIGQYTAFGNTGLTSLKFSAKTFATGVFNTTTTSSAKYTYLGFIGTGITTANTSNSTTPSTYATAYLPFGNMSSLNAIKFSNFTNATSDDSTTEKTSVMAKTTSDTWDEVARIISSFGKSKVDGENSDVTTTPANLSTWSVDKAITATTTTGDGNVVTSVELKNNSTTLATISESNYTQPITFDWEGVTWKIAIDTTAGTITITSSSNVDTYRAVVATSAGAYSNTYKAFFNTKSETTTNETTQATTTTIVPDSAITVTLNVVAASTNN